ncbi:hexosephosphate transport protein [Escherichia coli]|uniref:Hexosephosphate transport protein n=1 Tax=Escherichia coli TaxID=562 RepID=A0A377AAQ2_ECOLX|nr:hexosephosphate transport protein [Escherichia coli]
MLAFLNQVRKPTLDLPLEVRRKMWFKPFMQSYLVGLYRLPDDVPDSQEL